MFERKSLINPHLFYSTNSLVILLPIISALFCMLMTPMCILLGNMSYLYFKPYIQKSVGHFQLEMSHETTKQSWLAFPQIWYPSRFFTMMTGTFVHPTKPNPILRNHPWPLLLSQLMTRTPYFSLPNTSYTFSFLFISWPVPLLWQESPNLSFCLGYCLVAVRSVYCTRHLADGLSEGGNRIHSSSIRSGIQARSYVPSEDLLFLIQASCLN